MTHVKRLPTARAAAFEAASLEWLRDADAVPIVEVYSVEDREISMQRLDTTAPSAEAAERFGRQLWRLHSAGAPAFGAAPPGWTGDGFIADLSLPLTAHDAWGAFYASVCLEPLLRQAGRQLPASGVFDELLARLHDGDYDDLLGNRRPHRLHGDLWSGNVIWTPAGVTLIDPSAHGGRGETDLAMLELFGAPCLDRIEAAYTEAAGLDPQWRRVVPLHQVYPLLVHTVLFGGGYGRSAVDAATAALRL